MGFRVELKGVLGLWGLGRFRVDFKVYSSGFLGILHYTPKSFIGRPPKGTEARIKTGVSRLNPQMIEPNKLAAMLVRCFCSLHPQP